MRGPVSLVAGVVGAALAVPGVGWAAGLLLGWTVVAIINVVWILAVIWPMDAEQTRAHVKAEDPGRPIARIIALVGSVASLGGIVAVAVRSHSDPNNAFLVAATAVVAVIASWALIQVDYLLRYAHVYYESGGGIDFNQEEDPMYSDFGYFAVGLGMTYQVADTNIRTNAIRRIVIAQTLLAYLFGAVILATVINLISGL